MANTPVRYFRCPETLWEAVVARAEAEGVTTSDVLRDALTAHLGSTDTAE